MSQWNRRGFMLAGVSALALSSCQTSASMSTRPNIIVFVADDAGAEDFGIYGNGAIQTPVIDRLGRDGLTADAMILTTPQCSPSRISMLTGLYPHATGAEDLHMPMPEGLPILPQYLSEAGYFTGALRKLHTGPAGQAQFDWYENNLTGLPDFLEASEDKPFFMWVGFIDPHRDYDRTNTPQVNSPDTVVVPKHLRDTPATRRDLADYYNEISRMDGDIGRMLDEIEAAGRLENTIAFFISDNGAPFPRAKGTLYDAGVRTPFIAWRPGLIPAGLRHDSVMSVIDLAPTLLDLAGLPMPEGLQGESFKAGLSDPDSLTRQYAFSQRNWHNTDEHIRSVRDDRYKLIVNGYPEQPAGLASDISKGAAFKELLDAKKRGVLTSTQALYFQAPRAPIELYDLKTDPQEYHNRADDPDLIDVQARMLDALRLWQAETGDHTPDRRRRLDNVDRFTGMKIPDAEKIGPKVEGTW